MSILILELIGLFSMHWIIMLFILTGIEHVAKETKTVIGNKNKYF